MFRASWNNLDFPNQFLILFYLTLEQCRTDLKQPGTTFKNMIFQKLRKGEVVLAKTNFSDFFLSTKYEGND